MRSERVLIYLLHGVIRDYLVLLYSPEQLVAGRIVAALMHVRAVKGMALFRPSILAFLPLQSN